MLDLPADNKNAVYTRMISEREQMAAAYSAEGREEAQRVVNQTDREVTVIVSEAEAMSNQIIAEGESEYMRILAQAFAGRDRAGFYEYIRSLDALEISLQGNNKTLFLPIDSPLTKILLGYSLP
jgi:membrane protease subunit HflC